MVVTDVPKNEEQDKDVKIYGPPVCLTTDQDTPRKNYEKKSMHEQYLNSKGIQVFNDDILYFSYKIESTDSLGLDFFIESFYLEEQHRMNIRPQFQKVFNYVKNNHSECKYITATVIPKVKGSENMLRCLLKVGFHLDKANDNIITLRYLIPEKENDKYRWQR